MKVQIFADSRYPINRKRVRTEVKDFLASQGVGNETSVSIVVVGDRKMKELNMKHLGIKSTTDVLSFSMMEEVQNKPEVDDGYFNEKLMELEGDLYLGDVVISWPQVMKQALERQIPVDEEIDFLIRHGLLHLLGIHHD